MNGKSKSIFKPGKVGLGVVVCALVFGCQHCCPAQLTGSIPENVKAAAKAGNPVAQDQLAGEFVRHGNFMQAELWYRKAARQGYVHSQAKLGEMLMSNAGLNVNTKPSVKAAVGSEAIKWLTLAANGSNTLAQAELASAYFNGQYVKADLLEAYKWGDIAAKAPSTVPGSAVGTSIRDAATLKMSYDQIATAKQRVTTFFSHIPFTHLPPEPTWVAGIKLTGISGPTNARLAIINNHTFAAGDTSNLRLAGKIVKLRCLEVRDKSALVLISGLERPKVLTLADNSAKNPASTF
jgi:Sel1 repeat